MHLLKFISYTGQANCQAVFREEARALEYYHLALKERRTWLMNQREDQVPYANFEVTDDFGLTYSVNLLSCMVIVTSADGNAQCNEALRLANEVAEQRFSKGRPLGFMNE